MYTGIIFSASTNGQPVVIDATSSPGTLVHTFATATAAIEDVFLDCWNTASNDATITVEFGATGESRQLQAVMVAHSGPYRALAGSRIGGGAGLTLRAFATATGILRVAGGINRSA